MKSRGSIAPPTVCAAVDPWSHRTAESTAGSQETLSNRRQDVGMPGAHLLIVDDEDNLRSMLAAALRHHGFEVSTAENGREALDMIPATTPIWCCST